MFEPDVALAESLAEHANYWNQRGGLTAAQKRWSAFELELRTNLKGEKPAEWLLGEIRSGRWEKQQHQNMLNAVRNRVKLVQWKREGYTFDAEHRLVAPARASLVTQQRGVSREQRPQGRRGTSTASRATSPGRESDDDPEPPPACAVCGGSLVGKRRHARTCSTRCRVAHHRLKPLSAAERAALDQRYQAALRIVRQLEHDERPLLLEAVVWPTDTRLSADALRKVAA